MVLIMKDKKVFLLLISLVMMSLSANVISAQEEGVGEGLAEAFGTINDLFGFIPELFTLEKLIGGDAAAVFWAFHKTRTQRDALKLTRGWQDMLSNHITILTAIKDRTLKNPIELEDWKAEAGTAVNNAAEDIREAMGPSYATRFLSTESWVGSYASGSVNREHGGCRMKVEQYIKNLRTMFDQIPQPSTT